jgi:rhodanese-related sulfurtransferase
MTVSQSAVVSITPAEVHERLRRGDPIRLIDVREPIEYQIARIEGADLIPLADLASRLESLDRAEELVVVCHHGIRSRHACDFLVAQGFTRVRNLAGGIDRWSLEVDQDVPRY